jgi:arylsulfatase A-like enzyme
MNCLVISMGGVNARLLSCYGNPVIDTPAIDQFAADAFVFDYCFGNSVDPAASRCALWAGRRQLGPQRTIGPLRTVLIRDTQRLVRPDALPLRVFDEVVDCDPDRGPAGVELLTETRRWLQANSAGAGCVAFVDSGGIHLPHNQDVAAAVARVDQHLGELFDWLRERSLWDKKLIALTSDVGTAPREQKDSSGHLPIELCDAAHVPLIVRIPGAHEAATRTPALVQTVDLLPTVLDAMQLPPAVGSAGRSLLPVVRLEQRKIRDHVLVTSPHARWVRTRRWSLVLADASDGGSPARLFAQPEDRWEHNDLASQFPDVVAELSASARTDAGGDE